MKDMDEIKRDLHDVLNSKLGKGKVIILIGPRQVGKTTLLKTHTSHTKPYEIAIQNVAI